MSLRLVIAVLLYASAAGDVLVRKQTPRTLLSKYPVFLLTNDMGQPYLTSTPSGDQIGKMFIFLKDAERSLEELRRMPGASDARMWKTDLHRAVRMAQRNQRSGLYNDQGRELRMMMKFAPHVRQQSNAKMIFLGRGQILRQPPEIPVFYARGLAARKRGREVTPLFFSKEELDRVWARLALRAGPKAMPRKPRIEVTSLGEVMRRVEADADATVDLYVGEQTERWLAEQRRPRKARILRPRSAFR